jgi:hypothetical protein
MRALYATLLMMLPLASAGTLHAATAYKCADANGAISFQDQPCRRGSRQQVLVLPDEPSSPQTPTDMPPDVSSMPPAPVAAQAPPPPQIPPPAFYLCTRYDGSRYISDTGQGGSAAVPLGVLGVPNRSLADAYGGPNGIGVSAPGLRTIPHMPAAQVPFGGTYTWIDDECHFAAPREACAYLRSALDDVASELRRAFSDTEAQLNEQQAALKERMRGC